MKRAAFFFLLTFISTAVFSQSDLLKMRIAGSPQQEPSELVAKEIRDANGETCAGLIILSDLKGLSFQANNGIVKKNSNPGRDFLFLSPDERVVEIYCSGYTPLKIILNEVGIQLKSGQSWSVKITGDKKLDLIPVNFIVKPAGAVLFIDGINKGTNSTQQIAEGKHELKIEKEGFKSVTQTITVSTTQNLFTYTLQEVEPQSVTISSTPDGAKIFINNMEKGETNKGLFLFPAKYSLKLSKSGYVDVQKEIEVKENETNKFTYALIKNSGTLVINVTPSDAKILINKEDYTNKTTIELAPGRYKIEAEKNGYNGASETVDIELGKRIDKTFSLTAKTGGLQFSVTPIDAKVMVKQNGSVVQQWEGLKYLQSLQIGEYEIEISANGYAPQKKKITIAENKITTEEITLQKGAATTTSSAGIEFVFVQGGTFSMGSNDGEDDEKPIHSVTVSDFYIGKYEVTQKQWQSVMGNNPSNFKGDNLPVENVSWNDVQEFIRKLNEKENTDVYRLPTEAEWEFAARGGKEGANRSLQANGSLKYSGSNSIDNVAWYFSNSGNTTHEVGTKQPNELGIYDMTGNVWEWCSDWYDENYYAKHPSDKNSPSNNPQGANSGTARVLRGGSWNYLDNHCRVALRLRSYPDNRFFNLGFRLVRNN
jgi:sulfatase modifying factor 1